jgi:hypothetical protein
MIVFTLEDREAEFVVQVIGELPTNSGAFPLLQKLQKQAQESLAPEPKE